MNKELAQYINTLLAEKQREVKSKQDYLDKINGLERHFTEYQETVWELGMLHKAHTAMDCIIEKEEVTNARS
tara:strand:- start:247 stop:462 length:216 start_codon:yes stop_codon:yes gene_type:complete